MSRWQLPAVALTGFLMYSLNKVCGSAYKDLIHPVFLRKLATHDIRTEAARVDPSLSPETPLRAHANLFAWHLFEFLVMIAIAYLVAVYVFGYQIDSAWQVVPKTQPATDDRSMSAWWVQHDERTRADPWLNATSPFL